MICMCSLTKSLDISRYSKFLNIWYSAVVISQSIKDVSIEKEEFYDLNVERSLKTLQRSKGKRSDDRGKFFNWEINMHRNFKNKIVNFFFLETLNYLFNGNSLILGLTFTLSI